MDFKLRDSIIDQLKTQVTELESKCKILESSLPEGEKGLKMQIVNYQKNMEQLTLFYKKATSDKMTLAKEYKKLKNKLE